MLALSVCAGCVTYSTAPDYPAFPPRESARLEPTQSVLIHNATEPWFGLFGMLSSAEFEVVIQDGLGQSQVLAMNASVKVPYMDTRMPLSGPGPHKIWLAWAANPLFIEAPAGTSLTVMDGVFSQIDYTESARLSPGGAMPIGDEFRFQVPAEAQQVRTVCHANRFVGNAWVVDAAGKAEQVYAATLEPSPDSWPHAGVRAAGEWHLKVEGGTDLVCTIQMWEPAL